MSNLAALLAQFTAPSVIDLSLERMQRALVAFGNPHQKLPPIIHVAGTNGKGSTIAYLRAALEAAGKRCHIFTSPHLVRFNERIVVAGEEISDEALIPILQAILAKQSDYPLTFFEANTLAAFLAFAKHPADVVLLEVGMGGRFDATNVVEPILSIITPVALDHCEFLGDSLAKIAFEKAGIIKSGVPVVIAPQAPEAMQVIEEVAAKLGSPLRSLLRKLESSGKSGWIPAFAGMTEPNLAGPHQLLNAQVAAMALLVLREMGWNLSDDAIHHGLTHAQWPARLQRLENGRLTQALPEGWQLYLDGGHNPAAAEQLALWGAQHQPLHLVCGMTTHKDAAAFLGGLAPVVASIHLIDIPNESMAMPLPALQAAADAANVTAFPQPSLQTAIDAILEANRLKSGYILVCGSLYLAGSAIALHNSQ